MTKEQFINSITAAFDTWYTSDEGVRALRVLGPMIGVPEKDIKGLIEIGYYAGANEVMKVLRKEQELQSK